VADAVIEAAVLPPEIAAYTDYRAFLRDYYAHKKARRSGFSYRLFASQCGVKSPNYLQLVIQGKRNLSPELALRVGKALGLKPAERELFVALVRIDGASGEERSEAQKSYRRAAKRYLSKALPNAQGEILARWHHLLVRELVFLPDFEAEGAWISEKLRGLLSVEEAEASLLLLQQGGFLRRVESGVWRAVDPVIDTGDSFDRLRVLNTHRETLQAWAKLLPDLHPDERELGLLNIPIASDKIPEFKRRLREFQDEIVGWLQSETQPEQVVQLGVYLMPMTRPIKGRA
jgi:uncharacterized protein (TIGR02147 family)